MTWFSIALLLCALIVVTGAEWPRIARSLGMEERRRRDRARRKSQLRVIRDGTDRRETDDFAASVERDLSQLPTIDERDLL